MNITEKMLFERRETRNMTGKHFLYKIIVFCVSIKLIENYCHEDINQKEVKMCREPYYRCHYENKIYEKTINCNDISLSEIISYPDSGETSVSYPFTLQVYDSDIPALPTSAFKTLKGVSVLDMEHVQLKEIMPGAFNFLDRLRILNLKGNKLTAITDGIFNSLTALEELDLSSNRIANITDHAFAGGSLNYVDLSNNSILLLSEALMVSFTHLLHLNVSHNNFSEVNCFLNLSLHTLDMSYNNIQIIDFTFLSTISDAIDFSYNNVSKILNFNISTATKIMLSHNMIVSLEKNNHLLNLNVSYNRIEIIDSNLLGHKLQTFDASHNLISSIKTGAFFGLFNMSSLFLNNNNLSTIPNGCFRDLHSLNYLNLSGNKITYFSFGTFDNLIHLSTLDISDNNLQSLHQYAFHSLGNLKELSFRNNEISDINIEDFILHMQKLTEVKLEGNAWPCAKLVHIIHFLVEKHISISKENFWNESNVYGTKCYEILGKTDAVHETLKSDVNSDTAKLDSFFNEGFTKSLMYKYFNKDFKDSSFFKYLESLKNIVTNNNSQAQMLNQSALLVKLLNESKTNSNLNFTQTLMYNYFNKDFKSSNFYKYLESFRDQADARNSSITLPDSNLENIVSLFKEILQNSSKTNSVQKDDFSKGDMYNYFNKDFRNSSFFKYLESFSERDAGAGAAQSHPEHLNDSQMARLISNFEIEKNTNTYPNYTAMLSFISILIILNICVIIVGPYFLIILLKKHNIFKNEEVELI